MPSDGDGFGIVFLEAMMHGLPCVGLRAGAAAEIFEDNISGILVDRDDRDEMVRRISSLLLDEDLRNQMGDVAQCRYSTLFRGTHHSERLQSVLMGYFAKHTRRGYARMAGKLKSS